MRGINDKYIIFKIKKDVKDVIHIYIYTERYILHKQIIKILKK